MSNKKSSRNSEMVQNEYPDISDQINSHQFAAYSINYPAQNFKEPARQNLNANQGYGQNVLSGGDADRMMHYPTYTPACGLCDGNKISSKYLPTKSKQESCKYSTTANIDDYIRDARIRHEICNGSEGSAKSQKSCKTVTSRKSSQELRNLVTSRCRLHETIEEMCNADLQNPVETNICDLQDEPINQCSLTINQCKRCNDPLHVLQPQKNVTTEIGKGDFVDCQNINPLTISVDDVINSRVINPMIHRLHRIYLNNLKEEMSLMEDLERLPNKVNEVYKSIIFKQKD